MAKVLAKRPTARGKSKLSLAPPSHETLTQISGYLKRGLSLEYAAALSNVNRRVLADSIVAGRQGQRGFVEFTDAIDRHLAEFSAKLMEPIMAAADAGDVKAAIFLLKERIKPYEDRFLAKQFAAEDAIEAELARVEQASDVAAAAELVADAEELEAKYLADSSE